MGGIIKLSTLFKNLAKLGLATIPVISIYYMMPADTASVLAFVWHWPVIFPLLATVSAIATMTMLKLSPIRNRVTFWYGAYLITQICWALSQVVKMSAANLTVYSFWHPITVLIFVMSPLAYFAFILAYTEREGALYKVSNWWLFFYGSLVILLANLTPGLVSNVAGTPHFWWGYPVFPPNAPHSWVMSVWALTFVVVQMAMLFMHYHKIRHLPRKRAQARLFIIASIIPTTWTIVESVILPDLGVHTFQTFSLAFVAENILLSVAIFRYGFFSVEPAELADTILDTMSESVITLNAHHEIEYLNPGAAQLLARPLDKVRGQSLDALFDPATTQSIIRRMAAATKDALEITILINHHKIPISLVSSPIRNANGSLAGHILVFRDVTKEAAAKDEIQRQVVAQTHQIHEEQAKLRASIEGMALGFVLIDSSGQITIQNQALRPIFDLKSAATSLEQLDKLLVGFPLIESCHRILAGHAPIEAKEVGLGAKVLHVFLAPVTVQEKGSVAVSGTVMLVEDITEERVLARSKDEFFSIASHELRTPLTAIKGNTSMMMDYYKKVFKDPALREMLTDIHESSDRLIAIVNDFLDTSRLEQGKMRFKVEPFRLDPIIESVMYEMGIVINSKNITFKTNQKVLDHLPPILGDQDRIKQVLYNLLGNAVKFTSKGGITLTADLIAGDMVKVTITDTGSGIPLERQKLLFHKFQQAGSSILTRDTTRGTGLGLYISKLIVEQTGGHIRLESSAEGQGSTFSFTLPIATPKRVAAMPKAAVTTDINTGLTTTGAKQSKIAAGKGR